LQRTELDDDNEDEEHSVSRRSTAASGSTWISVAVNPVLTVAQMLAVGIGMLWSAFKKLEAPGSRSHAGPLT
jgi:hypothetical protein